MGVIQVNDNANGIKADLQRRQGDIPGALTLKGGQTTTIIAYHNSFTSLFLDQYQLKKINWSKFITF